MLIKFRVLVTLAEVIRPKPVFSCGEECDDEPNSKSKRETAKSQ